MKSLQQHIAESKALHQNVNITEKLIINKNYKTNIYDINDFIDNNKFVMISFTYYFDSYNSNKDDRSYYRFYPIKTRDAKIVSTDNKDDVHLCLKPLKGIGVTSSQIFHTTPDNGALYYYHKIPGGNWSHFYVVLNPKNKDIINFIDYVAVDDVKLTIPQICERLNVEFVEDNDSTGIYEEKFHYSTNSASLKYNELKQIIKDEITIQTS